MFRCCAPCLAFHFCSHRKRVFLCLHMCTLKNKMACIIYYETTGYTCAKTSSCLGETLSAFIRFLRIQTKMASWCLCLTGNMFVCSRNRILIGFLFACEPAYCSHLKSSLSFRSLWWTSVVASPIVVPNVLLLDEPHQDAGGEVEGRRKVCCR